MHERCFAQSKQDQAAQQACLTTKICPASPSIVYCFASMMPWLILDFFTNAMLAAQFPPNRYVAVHYARSRFSHRHWCRHFARPGDEAGLLTPRQVFDRAECSGGPFNLYDGLRPSYRPGAQTWLAFKLLALNGYRAVFITLYGYTGWSARMQRAGLR